MRVRENLSSVVSSIGKNNFSPPKKIQIGRVYGVVTTENTPTKEIFEKVGGFSGIGTIFYLDYAQSKEIVGDISNEFLEKCKKAKPLYPQFQYYPLIGELVFLEDLPSPVSQISNTSFFKYYVSVVNLWANNQQNSQPANDNASLGSTFLENPNIKSLISYQGDNILNGRQGSSLRFSTVTRGITPSNEWSQVGNENDPIVVLTNGLAYDSTKQYYVEQINKDASSIYLTSTQKIPLQTDKIGVLNNLTNPLNVPDYINSQIILNGDRIVLNSKKDEVMLFAKTNIELNTKNVINLNADARIHLNSKSIFLGSYNTNNVPQPVLLGNETILLLNQLQQSLTKLSFYLKSAVGVTEGAPMIPLNVAGEELIKDMQRMCDLIEKIPSQNVFTT
jgi:hypothetical protein